MRHIHTYFYFSFDERNPHVFFTNAFASCTGSVLAQACDASDSSVWKEENVVYRKRERRNLSSEENQEQESIALLTINVGINYALIIALFCFHLFLALSDFR